jgi:hypothetical protein
MPKSSQSEPVRDRGICPIAFHDARKFIQAHHAYLAAPRGCLFCIAAYDHGDIVAVAIVNRPVNPSMDDGVTAEISRLCTHDAPANTATALLRRVLRACRAIGYHRLISYVDAERDGGSFKAASYSVTAVTKRRQWHGKDFCIPANASDTVQRFELRERSYEAAVTAVTNLQSKLEERRDAWANRDIDECESSSAPRLFADTSAALAADASPRSAGRR